MTVTWPPQEPARVLTSILQENYLTLPDLQVRGGSRAMCVFGGIIQYSRGFGQPRNSHRFVKLLKSENDLESKYTASSQKRMPGRCRHQELANSSGTGQYRADEPF